MIIKDTLQYSWNIGLGTGIGVLSTFNHIDKGSPFVIHCEPEDFLIGLVDAFSIPETKVKVVINENPSWEFLRLGNETLKDSGKFFNPYIDIDEVNVKGLKIKLGHRKKRKAIGFAINNGDNFDYTKYRQGIHPYNKYYPLDIFHRMHKVFNLLGYDIITLDSKNISVYSKIYQIAELCDFVVGYEGGIMHLAHVLKVPTIIFPWRSLPDGNNPPDFSIFGSERIPAVEFASHMYHLDSKTFFVKSVEDFMSLVEINRATGLLALVDMLYEGKGNNFFLNNKLSYFEKEQIFRGHFTQFEQAIIKQYIGDLYVAGNKDL